MLGRIRCMRPDQWGNQDTGLKDGGGSIFLKKKYHFLKNNSPTSLSKVFLS